MGRQGMDCWRDIVGIRMPGHILSQPFKVVSKGLVVKLECLLIDLGVEVIPELNCSRVHLHLVEKSESCIPLVGVRVSVSVGYQSQS